MAMENNRKSTELDEMKPFMYLQIDLNCDASKENHKKEKIPIWEKVTITVEEASLYSNIGLNKIRELLADPQCPFSLYVGKKILIKRKEFEKFLSSSIEI